MEYAQPIQILQSYPLSVYIVLPLLTIYCGFFLNISNHYVLSPKIQVFLEKASITSTLAIQVIVDVLSNLSFITYSASAFTLTSPTDYSFRILQYYNTYWLTICLAIVIYMKVPSQVTISNIVFCKNGLILLLCYINIIYHYVSKNKVITLPGIMAGLYLLNLLLNSYEQKFIQTVLQLLNLKQPPAFKPKQKMISNLPTVQALSKNHPITRKQLSDQIQAYQKNIGNKEIPNNTKYGKSIKAKIDTKLLAREKLLQICMSVHLSLKKKQQQQINTVRQYFGFMNGTCDNGSNKQSKPNIGVNHRKTYFNNRNKDKKLLQRKSTKKIKKQQFSTKLIQNQKKVVYMNDKDKTKNGEETQGNLYKEYDEKNLADDEEIVAASSLESQSILFYIFPVKIFESSKVISTVFSILINLGFGFLLNYTQGVMNSLKYGGYSDFAFAILFLPMIPAVSPIEYANTMALSSLLKFGICGIFGCIANAIYNSDEYMSINWKMTQYYQFNTIVQTIILIFCFIIVLLSKNTYKVLGLLFLVALAANATIFYFSIASN